jgi:uncharacterized protein involved in exopolysaccharide biosynthesis
MVESLTNIDFYVRTLRRWWLVTVLCILGGLAGWLFSLFQSPIYEAKASFAISVDSTHLVGLQKYQEDELIGYTTTFIESTAVRTATVDKAQAEGITLDLADFTSRATMERQLYRVVLRVRHTDPQVAARLANLWAKTADEYLSMAAPQAELVEATRQHLEVLQNCATQSTQDTCGFASLESLNMEIDRIRQQYAAEKKAGQGISPWVVIRLTEIAQVPSAPVRFEQGGLVLAGALVGFLLAVWLLAARIPERLLERGRHAPTDLL